MNRILIYLKSPVAIDFQCMRYTSGQGYAPRSLVCSSSYMLAVQQSVLGSSPEDRQHQHNKVEA